MRALKHLTIAVLAILFCVASATAWVWNEKPELVNRADHHWLRRAVNTPTSEYEKLAELAKSEPAKALEGLEGLAQDLSAARRGDRLFPLRTRVLRRSAELALEQGNAERAMELARQAASQDVFDIATRLWEVDLLLGNAAPYRSRGLAKLTQLFVAFRERGDLAEKLHRELADLQLHREAANVLLEHLGSLGNLAKTFTGIDSGWEVFWHSHEEGFSQERSQMIDADLRGQTLSLVFLLPKEARTLRIDPPAMARGEFLLPTWSIETTDGVQELPTLDPAQVETNQMVLAEDGVTLDGQNDPYFVLELPEATANVPRRMRFQFEVQIGSGWIKDAAVGEGIAPRLGDLEHSGETSYRWRTTLRRLLALRTADLSPDALAIAGAQSAEVDFDPAPGDGSVTAKVRLPRSETPAGFELLLPARAGLLFELIDLTAEGPSGEPLDPEAWSITPRGMRPLEGRTWIIEAADTRPGLRLVPRSGTAKNIQVNGRLQ